ncbi:hypothetical protein DOY81_006492 [Sarcophaga bullata]|nr:hypothetical protein DOY81_006492 [Sarcophaga bullata]
MRCEGKTLLNTHSVQCLNFRIGEERNCSCPNLITCSQNSTRICTRTRRGCKVFSTQCELEEAKCRGEILSVVDLIHCQDFAEREEKACFCPNLQNCSRNATNLCVRDRRNNCTLLRNQCEVEQARCQGQALRIVPSIHCHNFTYQSSTVCSCPNLFNCSRTATSICARLTAGCKLLRNQCELEQEKCQQNSTRTVSTLHCLGFTFGQTRNCSCPNLQTCSRNTTNICVQTTTGCRLMRNECDLERAKCQGQNLKILPAIQCKALRPGMAGSCACPNWLTCRQNSTQVCIEISRGCKLLRNQCEVEQMRCQGEVFNITSRLQCQGFVVGQLKNCACPELKTCSRSNSSRTCVRNGRTCKLMTNNCAFELAKCRGETWCTANAEECANFPVGRQQRCSCPRLQTCERNNRQNICVHWRGACRLMKNQCDLEKAKCNGLAWSPTASLQCENYREGEWRWCACPRLLNCCNRTKSFCVKGPRGCKLMRSDCDLQLARCRGEVWTVTDDLQCQHFQLGDAIQTCTCPKLETCQQSSSITSIASQVCAQNIDGCKLFRNSCELERSRCIGEEWKTVDQVQCRNFPMHHTRSCYCPALEQCSNTTSVCGRTTENQCYRFRSECDMRWAQCEGQKLVLTRPQRCQGIAFNSSGMCKCPEQLNCMRNVKVCGTRNGQCKLFNSDCDYRQSICREDVWQRTNLTNCCQFETNEINVCTRNLQQPVCGRTVGNRCRLFPTRCDFNRAIFTTTREWQLVNRSYCQCLLGGRTASVVQPQ